MLASSSTRRRRLLLIYCEMHKHSTLKYIFQDTTNWLRYEFSGAADIRLFSHRSYIPVFCPRLPGAVQNRHRIFQFYVRNPGFNRIGMMMHFVDAVLIERSVHPSTRMRSRACRYGSINLSGKLKRVLASFFRFSPARLHPQRDASSSRFTHLATFARSGGGGRGPSCAASGESFYRSDDSVPLLGQCFNDVGGVHGLEL